MVDEHGLHWRMHLQSQSRVTSRQQALDAGWSEKVVDARLRSGTWLRLQRGAYATFTGEVPREAKLWAAVLRAGPGALLSHETAAEVHGFAGDPGSKIHVSIPAERRPARDRPIPGVVIHRSRRLVAAWTAPWELPRTKAEETVFDLVDAARTFDDAFGWICRALGRQVTCVPLLREALAGRNRIRWRIWLTEALADADEGIDSPLERHYARDVERAHGLPAAERQVRRRTGSGNIYLDNLYSDYGVCVELDGAASHPAEGRWRDASRDNANLVAGDIRTLRYHWVSVTEKRCGTALEVATLLRKQGWTGCPRPCGLACRVPRSAPDYRGRLPPEMGG